jgi:hypothetical protein
MHAAGPPGPSHAMIILRLRIDSWDCRGLSLEQQDARHYFMLQDALILAANSLACTAAHSLNAVEGREMRTGAACTPASQGEGYACHDERTGWLTRCSPTRSGRRGLACPCIDNGTPRASLPIRTPRVESDERSDEAEPLAEGPPLRVLSRTVTMAIEGPSLCEPVMPWCFV